MTHEESSMVYLRDVVMTERNRRLLNYLNNDLARLWISLALMHPVWSDTIPDTLSLAIWLNEPVPTVLAKMHALVRRRVVALDDGQYTLIETIKIPHIEK